MIFWTVKYTNTKTQIHKYTVMKCRKYPTCAIFSKSQGFQDIKNDVLDCKSAIFFISTDYLSHHNGFQNMGGGQGLITLPEEYDLFAKLASRYP